MKETKEILLSKITLPKFYKDWVVLPFEKIVIENKYLPQIKKLTEKDLKPSGEYPVIGQGENEIEGYSNDLSAIIKDFLPIIIFGDHTRRFKFVNKPVAIFADGAKIIKPYEVVNALFFYYFLKSIEIENQGYSRHNKFLSVISVPIPPLSEQNAIAEKLDILFSHLETSRKKLAKIPKYIAKFRQAVLQRAVSGELTEEWREDNNTNGQNIESFGLSIPDSWNFKKLSEICLNITDGDHQSPSKTKNGIPFIVISNIKNGKVVFDNKYFVDEDYFDLLQEYKKPKIGDILLSVVGTLGNSAIVEKNEKFCFQRHIALLRPNQDLDTKFAYFSIKSDYFYNKIIENAKGDAQLTLNLTNLRNIEIPFPPLPEQHEIVRQVELLFAIADKAQKQYETAMEYFQKLEKSVLLQAFSGELVEPQAQTESLEVLLERIKVERERLEKEKKVLRKEQAKFKQQNFMKASEREKIKAKIKEIALENYENEPFSADKIVAIREEVQAKVKDFDYDDFWRLFQELAQDKIEAKDKEPFFVAVNKNGKLHYNINP